jgi:hypothetical protein
MMICGCCLVGVVSCSDNEDNSVGGQLLEVYDVQGSQGKARLTVNGKVIFTTDVWLHLIR